MMILIFAGVAVALAVVTLVGTWLIERAHPPAGRLVDVEGGKLHVVELGSPDAPPVLLLHGASGNLRDMQLALGAALAARYRVILVDRPGHGWSDRPHGRADSSPLRQVQTIHQAVTALGVGRAVVLGHSWSGALATAYALAFPQDVAGLVLLAPVTHPWPGGVGRINHLAATPVIGPLLAHTIVLPSGYFLAPAGIVSVFAPLTPPDGYREKTAVNLLLRPSEFIANAQDLVDLKEFVRVQAPRYGDIRVPVVIISSDNDEIVSTDIHSRAIARQLPQGKLIVLPNVGHMVHYAAPDRVIEAVAEVMATGSR